MSRNLITTFSKILKIESESREVSLKIMSVSTNKTNQLMVLYIAWVFLMSLCYVSLVTFWSRICNKIYIRSVWVMISMTKQLLTYTHNHLLISTYEYDNPTKSSGLVFFYQCCYLAFCWGFVFHLPPSYDNGNYIFSLKTCYWRAKARGQQSNLQILG